MSGQGGPAPRREQYRLVLFAAAVLVTVELARRLEPVALTLLATVVFGLLLDLPVSLLVRAGRGRVSRPVATLGVVIGGLAAVGGAAAVLIPNLGREVRQLAGGRGDLGHALVAQLNRELARLPVHLPAIPARYGDTAEAARYLGGMHLVRTGGGTLLYLLVALFAAAWAVGSPQPLAERLLAFVPPDRRDRVVEVSGAVLARLRRWLAGQLVVNATVAAGVYLVLRLLGVPFAALFAVAAGVLESVPSIGVAASFAGPAALLLLAHPERTPWLLVGFVVVHQVEDRLLIPVVLRRAVDIPQTLLLLVVVGFGAVLGPVGMLAAVPVTAVVFTLHDELVRYDTGHPGPDTPGAAGDEPAAPER